LKFERDPVEAIDGILADLETDSVELQHKLEEIWSQRCWEMYLIETNIFQNHDPRNELFVAFHLN
jgi:hypothetical protein